jgi:catechol 2,3-dioxygenase-like lactoylglutathione lyase family enzyme
MAPRLAVVEVGVTDMDKGIAFYKKLGFGVAGRKNYPSYVELRHAYTGQRHYVTIILGLRKRVTQDPYPDGTQTILNFQVPNLNRFMASMRKKRVELLHDAPQRYPHGFFVAVKDPFGNVSEFLEFDKPAKSKRASKKK